MVEEFSMNSTLLLNSSKDGSPARVYYYGLAANIHFYGLLMILPFGLVGNIFSICVFIASPLLRRTITGQYLIALALADSFFLIGESMRWLASRPHNIPDCYIPQHLGLNFFDTSNAACKITHFLRYGSSLYSVWITIAIAVERLMTVAMPLKIDQLSTIRRTRFIICFIAVVSYGLGSFALWTVFVAENTVRGVAIWQCKIKYDKAEEYSILNSIIIKFMTITMPGILILILTLIIIGFLYRARGLRKSSSSARSSASRNDKESKSMKMRLSMETQMTVILVAVCIATTALRAPYSIAYYLRSQTWHDGEVDEERDIATYMAFRVTDMICTINYAINFVLYCVCGKSFRKEAERIFFTRRRGSFCPDNSPTATEELGLNHMKGRSSEQVIE